MSAAAELSECPACGDPVTPAAESYTRPGWHDTCAQNDVWANTPTGRRALADHPDDPTRPMTRTELAMLWDLLGRWKASHWPTAAQPLVDASYVLREHIDAELAERFGG